MAVSLKRNDECAMQSRCFRLPEELSCWSECLRQAAWCSYQVNVRSIEKPNYSKGVSTENLQKPGLELDEAEQFGEELKTFGFALSSGQVSCVIGDNCVFSHRFMHTYSCSECASLPWAMRAWLLPVYCTPRLFVLRVTSFRVKAWGSFRVSAWLIGASAYVII